MAGRRSIPSFSQSWILLCGCTIAYVANSLLLDLYVLTFTCNCNYRRGFKSVTIESMGKCVHNSRSFSMGRYCTIFAFPLAMLENEYLLWDWGYISKGRNLQCLMNISPALIHNSLSWPFCGTKKKKNITRLGLFVESMNNSFLSGLRIRGITILHFPVLFCFSMSFLKKQYDTIFSEEKTYLILWTNFYFLNLKIQFIWSLLRRDALDVTPFQESRENLKVHHVKCKVFHHYIPPLPTQPYLLVLSTPDST